MYYHAPANQPPANEARRPYGRRGRPTRPTGRSSVRSSFWAGVFLLSCYAAACVLLGLSSARPSGDGEKNLRAGAKIPTFNRVGAEAPVSPETPAPPEPVPSELALGDRSTAEPATTTPRVVTMEPVPLDIPIVVPQTVEPARLTAEPALLPRVELTRHESAESGTISEPAIYLNRASTFGESPMIRNWNVLALSALLALAAPPAAPAQDPELKDLTRSLNELQRTVSGLTKKVDDLSKAPADNGNETVLEEIQKLRKSVLSQLDKVQKELEQDVSKVKDEQFNQNLKLQTLQALSKRVEDNNAEILALYGELKKLKTMLLTNDAPPAPRSAAPPVGGPTGELLERLAAIERTLAKLQVPSVGLPNTRTALAAPTGGDFGRVMLVNLYPEDMLFIVNGRTHRVAPGSTLPLDTVPTGALSYEVVSPTWGLRARNTTALLPNETLTLTASR